MRTAPRAEPGHCVCSGFVPVLLCGKRTRAGRPGKAGVAAGCVSRAGLQGRCGSGNLQCAWPDLRSWSQRLPEAEKTWCPDCTWCSAAVATAPFLGLSAGSFSLPPSYLCTSVYSRVHPHSGDCRLLVSGMVYGFADYMLVAFHRCAYLPGARNLLTDCLRDPPVAAGKRFGKVSFNSIPSLGKVPLERRMELL